MDIDKDKVMIQGIPEGNSTARGGDYLGVALGDPAELVYKAMKCLDGIQFDTMVGRGLSGALVVPILARALGKWFAVVRKPQDKSHSREPVEGRLGDKWIFVDDLICSGHTFIETFRAIRQVKPIECVGAYVYGMHPAMPVYRLTQEELQKRFRFLWTEETQNDQ